MSMLTSSDRKDFRRQVFFSLAGIGVGLAVAGLIALLINNVLEPKLQVETQDLVEFSGDTFSIWYHVDSPYMDSRYELAAQLEDALDDLTTRLNVPIEELPLPIDVLVHDDPEMLKVSTYRRKSALAMYSFYAVIDLVYGEDPYSRLGELILAFGWGKCSSQLLYQGMLLNVASPGRNFHVPLAAAPPRMLHSLQDLIRLEAVEQFESTLYQRYQSPFSPRLATSTFEGLAEFRGMLSSYEDESFDYDIAELEAASLVQYLIECTGLEGFRSAWGPGTTEALIAKLSCGSVTEVADNWLEAVHETDIAGDGFEYYKARFLYEAGEIQAAANRTRTWNPQTLSVSESMLAVRTQLAAGDFESAGRLAGAADVPITDTLEEWVAAFRDWQRVDEGMFTIMGQDTTAALREVLQVVETAYGLVSDTLGFQQSELPDHVIVFYYETDSGREEGTNIVPVVSTHRTLWHLSSQDNIVEEFISTLPTFVVRKETSSNLLRRGLTAALTIDREELIERGCELLRAGEWPPLWKAGFGGEPIQVLEVQAGLMMAYMLDTYGADVIRALWLATARMGGGVSLDTALGNVLDTSRTEIERELIDSVLDCE